jgi:hypothetical protein
LVSSISFPAGAVPETTEGFVEVPGVEGAAGEPDATGAAGVVGAVVTGAEVPDVAAAGTMVRVAALSVPTT